VEVGVVENDARDERDARELAVAEAEKVVSGRAGPVAVLVGGSVGAAVSVEAAEADAEALREPVDVPLALVPTVAVAVAVDELDGRGVLEGVGTTTGRPGDDALMAVPPPKYRPLSPVR
jgi:hypothetical protein